jgi:hypothetical protein
LQFFSGPALGSALYSLGGFTLPFVSVGSATFLVAILLLIIVPNATMEEKDKTERGKSLTFTHLLNVIYVHLRIEIKLNLRSVPNLKTFTL